MLQQLVEAEAGAAQRGRRVGAKGGGEGEHDRFLAFLGQPGLAISAPAAKPGTPAARL